MNGIVIIGGSIEAFLLARAVPGARVILPAAERVTRRWPCPVDIGPVSADVLRGAGAGVVVEAAHPCDTQTAFATHRAAHALDLPHLQLVRPPWRATRRDLWVPLREVRQAAEVIPDGARVLVATGGEALSGLRAMRAEVLMRRIGEVSGPLPLRRGRFLAGQGPFTIHDEMRLLRKERIDWLLVSNAGGTGGWPKLAAARTLRLPVAMIDRPRRPGGPRVQTVKEALTWLSAHPV
ncbi:precorrin-6A/cobalt-precorrin-6A reductase [Antarctobacter heliothermus]|uniref:Precorrin-6A/cobalt-precorrin-6A reductase n=1 Tax=Antarctobacter heliothermus TaxID=74033 RepID=A0A239ANE8_9RHOB|nr:precorrin-6A/cobalt-precorrin-6A reductase [Antarctobacter heliothermus]SNR97216.1 precorrin-6A/cobalt-precorrin-6A reductase [Antarctobacter heliothermus]